MALKYISSMDQKYMKCMALKYMTIALSAMNFRSKFEENHLEGIVSKIDL